MARTPKSLAGEIAVRSRSVDFYGLGLSLPNPDPVLKKQGKDIIIYKELLVDDRVGGSWGNRKGATLSLEWEIDRGKKGKVKSRQARVIEDLFTNTLDVQRIMGEILQARLFGYQPLEVLWQNHGGLLLPTDVVGKPQEWFLYGTDNALRFRSRDSGLLGEELPPRAILCPTSEASYANPYGLGLLASCFWPVTFKKGGWRFWITFAEKYGQAFAVGKIRRGAEKKEMDELSEMLEKMVQDAIAVIYDDSSVELKDAPGKGASSELFKDIIAEANTAISTIILGHAGAGQSTSGKLGGEDAARDVREDLKDADKKLVCSTMNQLIRWIAELNWGNVEVPSFSLWEEEDVDKDQAERDEKLTASLEKSGLKLSRSYYQRTYNLEDDDLEEAEKPEPPSLPYKIGEVPEGRGGIEGPAFAEAPAFPDQAAIDKAAATIDPAVLQNWVEQPLTPVLQLINGGASLEEIMEKLAGAFPDMSTETLQEMLTRAMFVAEAWGRLNADD